MDDNAVTARIQTLISFVFASYVTIVLNRWDRVRNTTLGKDALYVVGDFALNRSVSSL